MSYAHAHGGNYDRGSGTGLFEGLALEDKRRLIYGGLAIIAIGTGAIIGVHAFKKHKSHKAHRRSLDDEDPAYFAKQIYLAMDGWGTDEDAIYNMFAKMPSMDFYKKVQKSYSDLYKNSVLEEDLQNELSGEEYEKITTILDQKPKKKGGAVTYDFAQWSQRLHTASDGWGTDEAEIYRVLEEVPSKAVYQQLNAKYNSDWGQSIDAMMKDELGEDEYKKANSILDRKS